MPSSQSATHFLLDHALTVFIFSHKQMILGYLELKFIFTVLHSMQGTV